MILPLVNRFLHWMVVGILTPVMVLMMGAKGASLAEVGFVVALMSTVVVVFELPSGVLSDRIGRRRVYLLSLLVFGASLAVLMLAQGLALLGLAFGLFGLGRALSSGSIESDFIDQYKALHGEEKLGRLITGMNVAETLGLALGALLGGFLPDLTRVWFPENPYAGNAAVPLLIVAMLFVLTLATHAPSAKGEPVPFRSFLRDSAQLVRSSGLLVVLLTGSLVWGFSFAALEVYWQPHVKTLLGNTESTAVFGYLNGGYFIAAALGSLAATGLIALLRLKDLVAIGLLRVLLGAGLLFLGFQNQLWAFAVLYLLLMGFNGLLNVPEATVFNRAVPDEKRSSLLSLSSLVMQGGGIVASVVFSLVVAGIGIPWVLAIAGAVFALSSVLYFAVGKKRP